MYETQVEQLRNQRMNMETMVMQIENANVNKATIQAMKQGANQLKSMHKQMDPNQIDTVIDDIREQMDASQEISEMLGQSLNTNMIDEDELDLELQGLEDELEQEDQLKLDAALSNIDKTKLPSAKVAASSSSSSSSTQIKAPSAPTKTPTAAAPVDDEEEELRRLEAQFS
eukprot:c13521_g1_i1.p1 GENE.c13521_g1_i1~~c13521_g1_i1.p1  ORF type:complete len:196 (+),score=23.94 c13521_g1_i1:78-590(+)